MRTLLISALLILPVAAQFRAMDKDGRIEIRDGGKRVFAYQHAPLKDPKGGEIFAASAFLHPLTTPSGFVLTNIQPDDHLHHLGVWWPWKLVEVDGKKYVTWELQRKQGRHRAVSAKIARQNDNEVIVTAREFTELSNDDGKSYEAVIKGTAVMLFTRHGEDGYRLDIDLHHTPVEGKKPTILKYRYSGFCWRGTPEWTADTSTMLTSEGHHRDNGNHKPARWCQVSGMTPEGKATMLVMSAAAMDEGQPELLRVWGSEHHHGNPFVNFNPVVKQSFELKEENEAVSRRSYRLIMVDREMKADEARELWDDWTKPAK